MDVLDRPLTRRSAGAIVSALLVTGLAASVTGCAAGGSEEPTSAVPSSSPSPSSTPTPLEAQVAQRVGSVVPQPPVRIELPDGNRVPVRAVGTTANGLLDVPSHIEIAGWWSGGSQLGDPFGSTLVAAHVDSKTEGLGPFASLLSVRAGERVRLWSKGLRQTFVVQSLTLRPRGTIGATSPLHSPEGERRLVLVTCAGPYDAARGGYQNLAVVVAVPRGKAVPRP